MFLRRNKYHVYLTEEEIRLVVKAMMDERNALIAFGRHTDAVDDLLVRILSKTSKLKFSVANWRQ